jgi:pectinesterase inhibitor-like protein
MSAPKSLLVAAVALAALLTADATVETTCKAAAENDHSVDYDFCVAELTKHRDSPGADTWGLAKVSANVGLNNAAGAVHDIEVMLAGPPQGTDDDKKRAALGQCRRLYFDAQLAFASAYDEINWRHYAAGKQNAAEAMSLARRCDDVFSEAGMQSPLAQRAVYTVKIGTICTVITGLI